jgi:hypothetical protein
MTSRPLAVSQTLFIFEIECSESWWTQMTIHYHARHSSLLEDLRIPSIAGAPMGVLVYSGTNANCS